jgi:hypothetical protein
MKLSSRYNDHDQSLQVLSGTKLNIILPIDCFWALKYFHSDLEIFFSLLFQTLFLRENLAVAYICLQFKQESKLMCPLKKI